MEDKSCPSVWRCGSRFFCICFQEAADEQDGLGWVCLCRLLTSLISLLLWKWVPVMFKVVLTTRCRTFLS